MPHVTTMFITAAAGFIGAELVKLLVARGHQVVGVSTANSKFASNLGG
jgi:nucleoside-diphosphate-sugar epimerase